MGTQPCAEGQRLEQKPIHTRTTFCLTYSDRCMLYGDGDKPVDRLHQDVAVAAQLAGIAAERLTTGQGPTAEAAAPGDLTKIFFSSGDRVIGRTEMLTFFRPRSSSALRRL